MHHQGRPGNPELRDPARGSLTSAARYYAKILVAKNRTLQDIWATSSQAVLDVDGAACPNATFT